FRKGEKNDSSLGKLLKTEDHRGHREAQQNGLCGLRRQVVVPSGSPMPGESDDRRRSPRMDSRVPVSIRQPNGTEVTGHTRDLSANGMFLYAEAGIQPGSEVEMVLILPPELMRGEKCWVCCQASVVRVENTGDSGGLGVAVDIRNMQVS